MGGLARTGLVALFGRANWWMPEAFSGLLPSALAPPRAER